MMKARIEAALFVVAVAVIGSGPFLALAYWLPAADLTDVGMRAAGAAGWGWLVGRGAGRFVDWRFRKLREERNRLIDAMVARIDRELEELGEPKDGPEE